MPSGPVQDVHEFFKELSSVCQHGISATSEEVVPGPGVLRSTRRTSPGHLISSCMVTAGHRHPRDEVEVDHAVEAKGGSAVQFHILSSF